MITFALVERTPQKLRYTAIANGQATAAPDSGVIPNAEGVTPDLRTDAGGTGGFQGSPIDNLVSTPAANQAAARALLDGQGLTAVGSLPVERGHLSVTPRNSQVNGVTDAGWSVEANEGAAAGSAPSAGFAVIVVSGPNTDGAAALVELLFDHSVVR